MSILYDAGSEQQEPDTTERRRKTSVSDILRKAMALTVPALVAGGGVYAWRRGMFGNTQNPILGQGAANRVRQSGYTQGVVDTPGSTTTLKGRLYNYLHYGTTDAVPLGREKSHAAKTKQLNLTPVSSPLEDKFKEHKQINAAVKDFLPGGNTFKIPRLSPARSKDPKVIADAIRAGASGVAGKSFILKGHDDYQTGSGLITDKNLDAAVKQYLDVKSRGGIRRGNTFYSLDKLKALKANDPETYARLQRGSGLIPYGHIHTALNKLPLLAQTRLDVDPSLEHRVHVLQGKVIPGATINRAVSGGVGGRLTQIMDAARTVAGVPSKASIDAEQFVQQKLDALSPAQRKRMAQTMAPDVGTMTNGQRIAFETNAGGHSGFLERGAGTNILFNHLRRGAIEGRDTELLAGARAALAAGAAGAGGVAAYTALRKKKDTEQDDDTNTQETPRSR